MISFRASPIDNGYVRLTWETATEINNDYFTIERSADGEDWEAAFRVEGADLSLQILRYTQIDQQPYPGMSYYRLKQTDYDGHFEYSEVVSVEIGKAIKAISIYPNPATEVVNLEVQGSSFNGEMVLTLYDLTGNQLRSQVLSMEEGFYQGRINLLGLLFVQIMSNITSG